MIRTILALALVAFLAGCDTTSSSSVPSGAEAPRLTVTVLSGTKAAPVDSPTVRVAWEQNDSVSIVVMGITAGRDGKTTTFLTDDGTGNAFLSRSGSGSIDLRVGCQDSVKIAALASALRGHSAGDTTKTVYCK